MFLFHFFHCRSFSPWWPLAFLIFSPLLLKFSCFSSNKIISPLSMDVNVDVTGQNQIQVKIF